MALPGCGGGNAAAQDGRQGTLGAGGAMTSGDGKVRGDGAHPHAQGSMPHLVSRMRCGLSDADI
eukprot:952198-Rhodomonas_salina.4